MVDVVTHADKHHLVQLVSVQREWFSMIPKFVLVSKILTFTHYRVKIKRPDTTISAFAIFQSFTNFYVVQRTKL